MTIYVRTHVAPTKAEKNNTMVLQVEMLKF